MNLLTTSLVYGFNFSWVVVFSVLTMGGIAIAIYYAVEKYKRNKKQKKKGGDDE